MQNHKKLIILSMSKSVLFIAITLIFIVLASCKPDENTDEDGLPSNVITKITIDKNGIKWIATDNGLVSFDGEKWTAYPKTASLYKMPVLDVILNENTLLAATFKGALKSNITNQTLNQSQVFERKANGLISDTVNKIATDKLSTTFFGTPKGLSILKENTWTFYDGNWGRSKDNFLTTNKITGIATASNGWNYVSTEGGGVSCFKFVDAVTSATKYFLPWADGLNSDVVYTVVIVDDSCQWYGTDAGASYHTSNQTKANWDLYYSVGNSGLASDSVYAIAKDDAKNTVWFGTHRGVSKLENNVITNFTTKDGLIDNKINTLAIDIDGSVWFGTDKGLSHFKNGSWKNYMK